MALLSPRMFTVPEYHWMAEVGVLQPEERVELLDGVVVEMSPIGPSHWDRMARIMRYLPGRLGDSALVVPEASLPLGMHNMPQPDVAILIPEAYGRTKRVPRVDEILALIEVSETSFANDVGPKLRLYASSNISDYLVVDLNRNRLLHHSNPRIETYARMTDLTYGDTFTLARLPEITLSVDPFLEAP